MKRVIVIGGGPAGIFAALAAAKQGHSVILLEQNEKLGKKLFITGKGRCNITNAGEMENLFGNVVSNPKFLYSAFYGFDNFQVIDFFENHGVKTKIERGNRVFPLSDHSSDVIAALEKALRQAEVEVKLHRKVERILVSQGRAEGVMLSEGEKLLGEAVIIATGGFSYQSTGARGDGYRFAKETGHTLTSLYPALVPMNAREEYVAQLQGLSLKNVEITVKDKNKILFKEFGEMLFTHFGVSGPLVLSASSQVGKVLLQRELSMYIDLKPALSWEQLDKRLLREFESGKNKQLKNVLTNLLPAKMRPLIPLLSGVSQEKKVNEITKGERSEILRTFKEFPLTLTGLRDFNEAIITKGGVSTKEINPSTMESKILPGVFFAGEVMDVDALTGGYNLQIAWSTGYLAGSSV
ncbi:MAG: NAD(P)/FAD-dependent oxidoreductase [Lachnospiraceae bacterium]|nr:NAD(P)/FAD-dependent oxidoreductase [Lachnospiraceae bacterium]